MTLRDFNALLGQDSYVRCNGKIRKDTAVVSVDRAEAHVDNGGQLGWWVRSGYIVVDIDEGKEQALAVVKRLKLKTLMCKTPKGLHLYFKTDREFPQKVGMVLPCGLKCDFRCANKGYVIIPFGSSDRKFNRQNEIADLPLEFTPMIGRKESLLNLQEGDGRNTTLFSHLMAYKNRGASDGEIIRMAGVINRYIFKQPMSEEELAVIVGNTKKYEASDADENPYVIYGKEGRPAQINHRAIRDYFVNRGDVFVLGGECYMYRDGVYSEAGSEVRSTIIDMVAYDNLITFSRVMECYKLLTDDMRLRRNADDINADKNLINFRNGVWDIENQTLIPHDSAYLQTIQIPHDVGKRVKFTKTKLYRFMVECGLSKPDIQMIIAYMAYCLTLGQHLKTFMILWGPSNTGKSVLIRFLTHMIGEHNTSALSMHELNARFYPSQLYGRLMNACGDNGSMSLQNIEMLKKITGGDVIMHEKKGKEPFFFTPFAKLIFSFNQLPLQLEEKSNAFYKRMRVLHMAKELYLNDDYVNDLCSDESVSEVIPFLLSRLPLESIPRTKSSEAIAESLRQDSDTIHAFLERKCNVGNPDTFTVRSDLYQEYVDFCVRNGRDAMKKHGFMRSLRSMGYNDERHGKSRMWCFYGIEIKSRKYNRKGIERRAKEQG